jgi:hypothetical protein
MLALSPCLALLGCALQREPGAPALALSRRPRAPTAPSRRTRVGRPGVYGSNQSGTTPDDRYDDDHDHDLDDQHITLLIGERWLDRGRLGSGRETSSPAASSTTPTTTTPATAFEVGGIYSQDDDEVGFVDVDADTLEAYGGFRHTFNPDDDDHDRARTDRNGDGRDRRP